MALHKLFDNSPKFGAADIVGRVRSGAQIQGRPEIGRASCRERV